MGNINVVDLDKRTMCDVAYKCSHRNTETETHYNGYYSPEDEDYIEHESQVEVCLNPLCEAWRYPEGEWQDDYMVEVEHGEDN